MQAVRQQRTSKHDSKEMSRLSPAIPRSSALRAGAGSAAVAGVVALVAARVAPARVALYVAVPALLGLSRPLNRPELAWVALSLFVVALALQWSEFKRRE